MRERWEAAINAALVESIQAQLRGDVDGVRLAQANAVLCQIAQGLARRLDAAEAQLATICAVVEAEQHTEKGKN